MTTANQAEQFLARNGIKFRAVLSERGLGEWNVTFSRKGGGRLKLEYSNYPLQPSLRTVIEFMVIDRPAYEDYQGYANGEADYKADLQEAARVHDFFTEHEIQDLLHLQCELA